MKIPFSEKMSEKKEKEEEGLVGSGKGRKKKIEGGGVLAVGAEWLTPDEEEIDRNERDPEKTFVDINEINESESFAEYVKSFDVIDEASEDLQDEYEKEIVMRLEMGESYEDYTLENFLKERDMPNYQYYKDLSRRKEEEKAEKEKEFEAAKTYSVLEFKLMEDCLKFRALTDKEPQLKKLRPVFTDGEPLTDEQVSEQVKEWFEVKNKNKFHDYTPFELDLMKKCSAWNYFNREILKYQKGPAQVDGTLLSDKEIDEQIADYKNFQQEHPDEFAELKVEIGDWFKDNFNWKTGEYKGKPQWFAYKSKIVKSEKGESRKLSVKYLVNEIPADFKPEDVKNSYFVIKGTFKVKDDLSLMFIELKPPYVPAKDKVAA